ncbi:hypothetical protein Tco_1084378 [Tanacetum coccineum]
MPTPSPSPPISLSPPSLGEHLARCTNLSTHSSPPHVPSPLLPSSGCPTQIQTLKIASTQALIDAVTATLPSPPLPPSLYLPPPIDRRDDVPEFELPPRKSESLWTHSGSSVGLWSDMKSSSETIPLVRREPMRPTERLGSSARIESGPQFIMSLQDLPWSRNEGVVCLTRWIEKMESVFNISGCAIENQVKFATCTLLGAALTWWNVNPDMYQVFAANEIKKVDKYISGLSDNIYGNVKSSKPKMLDETIELANDLMDQKLRTYAERQIEQLNERMSPRSTIWGQAKRSCMVDLCSSAPSAIFITMARVLRNATNVTRRSSLPSTHRGHFKRDYPKLKNKDEGNGNAQGWVYAVGNAEKNGNASRNPDSNVITGTFLLNNRYASILFDTDADRSFISTAFSSLIDIAPTPLENSYDVELADGKIVGAQEYMARGCQIFLAQICAKKEEDKSEGKQLKSINLDLSKKIVSRLAILGVIIAQEDLNLKFLSSLPPEWNTHVVVWMNKPKVETMSIDNLYNNFKIVEQKVKKTVGTPSGVQNLAFMTSPSSINTNDANTASSQVSAASPSVNTSSPQVCTASVSDNTAVVCFYNCHKLADTCQDEAAERGENKQGGGSIGGGSRNQDNTSEATETIEDTSTRQMLAIDGVGFDWSDMDRRTSSDKHGSNGIFQTQRCH